MVENFINVKFGMHMQRRNEFERLVRQLELSGVGRQGEQQVERSHNVSLDLLLKGAKAPALVERWSFDLNFAAPTNAKQQ